jgi:hypothetical protein
MSDTVRIVVVSFLVSFFVSTLLNFVFGARGYK